jgi:hypothetical protein
MLTALFYFSQAVERRRDREAALALFNEAIQLAPENALVRYRRAKILISMRKYQVSHEELICVFLTLTLCFTACSRRPGVPQECHARGVKRGISISEGLPTTG